VEHHNTDLLLPTWPTEGGGDITVHFNLCHPLVIISPFFRLCGE